MIAIQKVEVRLTNGNINQIPEGYWEIIAVFNPEDVLYALKYFIRLLNNESIDSDRYFFRVVEDYNARRIRE